MPDSDVNRLGDAVADIYEDVRTTNKNYIDSLTGGQSGKSPGRSGGVIGTNADDMGRIMAGTDGIDDEFYNETPTNIGRNSPYSLSDDEPAVDEIVPEYDDIAEGDQQYAENDGGAGIDVDIDTPNTTKGKIISLIYVVVMVCILLFGLNFLVSRFKAPEFKEESFNLGGIVDSVRGVNESQLKTHDQIDSLLGVNRNKETPAANSANNDNDSSNNQSTDIGTPNSDLSGSEWNNAANVSDIITSGDKNSYSTFDELRSLRLSDLKSYDSGIEYVSWDEGVVAYSGSNGREYVTGTVHEKITYLQLDENGIVLKSPVSKAYLYVIVPGGLKSKIAPEGVVTVRSYKSKSGDEIYLDVIEAAVVVEKNSVSVNQSTDTDDGLKGNRESLDTQIPNIDQSVSEMLDSVTNLFDD